MKKFQVLLCFSVILLPYFVFGQKNDWQEEGLKSRVIQITTNTYWAQEKFGEIVKGEHQHTSTTWFNEKGYMRRSQNHEIPKYSYQKEKDTTVCRDYIYNKYGQLEQIVVSSIIQKESYGIFIPQKVTNKIIENSYDASNRILETNEYDKNRNLLGKTKHHYTGNKHEIIKYNENGDEVNKITEINENRKRTTISSTGSSWEEYYDANDKLIKTVTGLSGGNGVMSITSYNKYNRQGDPISTSSDLKMFIRETGGEQHTADTSYEYEYDKMNNWIIRREYNYGKIKNIKERKIIYAVSDEDFRRVEKEEKAEEEALSEKIIRAKHRADSIRYREDSIRRIEIHRQDSIDNIKKLAAERDKIIQTNKEYMDHLVNKHFQASSILTIKTNLEKVNKITINEDGTILFTIKGAAKNDTPALFTYFYSWSARSNLQANAYISQDGKYAVIFCILDTGETISLFNKAAILYVNGKIYEIPGKIRKTFIKQMQAQKSKLLPY